MSRVFLLVMELKGFLSHLQKGETQSMEDYLRSVKVMADQLASIEAPISELELINDTLGGLDPAYDSLVAAVQYCPVNSTFDELRTKLIMFEQRVKLG